MKKVNIDILIPIFNEGDKILKLMDLFQKNIKNKFRIIFCYDHKTDDIFIYKDKLQNFNFEIEFVKNLGKGPCSAIKEGFKKSKGTFMVSP